MNNLMSDILNGSARTHARLYARTGLHAQMHVRTHARTHTHTHIQTHTHTHTHTQAHTHTHTHTHTRHTSGDTHLTCTLLYPRATRDPPGDLQAPQLDLEPNLDHPVPGRGRHPAPGVPLVLQNTAHAQLPNRRAPERGRVPPRSWLPRDVTTGAARASDVRVGRHGVPLRFAWKGGRGGSL